MFDDDGAVGSNSNTNTDGHNNDEGDTFDDFCEKFLVSAECCILEYYIA
jgi:hypothetical protein